jgi:hypothetical protein
VALKKTSRTTKPAPAPPVDAAPVKAARPRRATAATAKASATTPAENAPLAASQLSAGGPAGQPRVRRAAKAPARAKVTPAPTAEAAAPQAPRPVADDVRAVTDEDIRVRAYFLSLEYRGRASDIDFWLIAERELRSRAGSRD